MHSIDRRSVRPDVGVHPPALRRRGQSARDDSGRYADFFGLFRDFKGYTKFFLLDDLVNDDGSVRFFLPFADFGTTSPFPGDLDEYRAYREAAMAFIAARAERMASTEVQVA